MKSILHRLVSLALLLICLLCAASQVRPLSAKTSAAPLKPADAATQAKMNEAYGKLPLSFEVNQGQADPSIKFISRGANYTFSLAPTEATLKLRGDSANQPASVRMKLINANPSPKIEGVDQLPGKSNYLTGADPKSWRTNIPNYARVRYDEVWPGIDVIFYCSQQCLEYDFLVAPGADPGVIRLSFAGARKLCLDESNDLLIQTPGGEIRHRKPILYQQVNGQSRPVSGRYVLIGEGQVGFRVGRYDRSRLLVIDPVLVWIARGLAGNAIAVDSQGQAYVTGSVLDFPITAGAFQTTPGGVGDVFVAKLNAAGTALIYATYLGGREQERAGGIAVDQTGAAYITGSTRSANFPTLQSLQPFRGGIQI